MFDVSEFLMKTLKGMIGNYPDFQVREYAANWYAKGKLTEDHLAEIDIAIEDQYKAEQLSEETEESIQEETIIDLEETKVE